MTPPKYKLEILPLFEDDLREILDYITEQLHNPAAAVDLLDDIEEAITERMSCPKAFLAYPTTKKRKAPYYCIHVKNFMVFYVVIGNVMEVRRILYARRNITDLIG